MKIDLKLYECIVVISSLGKHPTKIISARMRTPNCKEKIESFRVLLSSTTPKNVIILLKNSRYYK